MPAGSRHDYPVRVVRAGLKPTILEVFIMSSLQLDFIKSQTGRSAKWRESTISQYPDDPRIELAAMILARLAKMPTDPASSLRDGQLARR